MGGLWAAHHNPPGAIIMKYVAPSAPLSIGGVLDNWIRLFRTSFAGCWAFALAAAAAGAVAQFMYTPTLPTPGLRPLQAWMQLSQFSSGESGPGVFLVDILLGFITLLAYGALLTQQEAVVRGEEPFALGAAFTKGLRRIPQMLLGFIVLILIIVAIFIPVGIVGGVLYPLRQMPLVMLCLGVIAVSVVILLIYVLVRMQVWMAVMFSENLGGPSSLGRTWELMKGHWWRVTGIAFVSGVVIWVLSMATGGMIGMVIGFVGIRGTSPDLLVRRVQIIGAAGEVARLLTMPLLTAVWLAIYQDLKLRREGGDLAARTEALSGT